MPDPETPVTAMKVPSGNETSMVCRLCSCAPTTVSSRPLVARPPDGRGVDDRATRQVGARERVTAVEQVVDGARHDDLATVLTRARPDVDDPVGAADGVLVVLDDDQRVAHVAQPGQRLDQPVVVALVQPDRGLVEDVEHAHQPGADLGGQPDALRLTAGQGARGPLEGEVVEPHVEQETEPRVDLLDAPLAICVSAVVSSSIAQERVALADRQTADVSDRTAADGDGKRLRLEARPLHAGHGTSRM